jgi:hypothetical protein
MFRERDPQGELYESSSFLTSDKARRLATSWAGVFREKALRLVDETRFASMYCEDNGRPNVPVQLLVSVLVLKEMFDLTDVQTLEHVEWNLQWHHALRLRPEDARFCQKTLHNFRVRLMEYDTGRVVFEDAVDKIIDVLGTKVTRQRLDSTHIVSNVARLTRLGLFVETIRVFLRRLQNEHPRLFTRVAESLRRRYLRDSGENTRYGDARSGDSKRRLGVCARDVHRLLSQFAETEAAKLEDYALLKRLFEDQCEIDPKAGRPEDDDDDAGEHAAPVRVKPPKAVESSSLQTPHDPDVTYSGHKGKGYEVQVAETTHKDNATEIITDVAVTPSCASDANATMPTLERLSMRGLHPDEVLADTTYGSGANAVEAERFGTKLVSPVGGRASVTEACDEPDPLRLRTAADFTMHLIGRPSATCPAGDEAIGVFEHENNRNRVELRFAASRCESCPLSMQCPATYRAVDDAYVMRIDLVARNLEQRRREQATPEFAQSYAARAGVEATNSEMKRAHGLGRPRVRGRPRVELATYLKATACNVKRMIQVFLKPPEQPVVQPA